MDLDQIASLPMLQHQFTGVRTVSPASGLFVFVALSPKSTAKVMAGRSVHLTTLFAWASLNKQLPSTVCKYFRL